jgi:hypothetical protein
MKATQLAPGVYLDADQMIHIDIPGLLAHCGLEDTPRHRQLATEAALATFARAFPALVVFGSPAPMVLERETEH